MSAINPTAPTTSAETGRKAKPEILGDFELGESFPCACGERHKLEGAYLAAHWHEKIEHTCPKCGTVHELRAGRVVRLKPAGQADKAATLGPDEKAAVEELLKEVERRLYLARTSLAAARGRNGRTIRKRELQKRVLTSLLDSPK